MLKYLDLHIIGITLIPFVMVVLPVFGQLVPGYWPLLLVALFPQGRIAMRAIDLHGNAGTIRYHLLTNELVVLLFLLLAGAAIHARS